MDVPRLSLKIIQEFHDGMAGAVSIGGSTTDPFKISHGLKQECVLARTLFTIFMAALLSTVSEHISAGVYIRTRSDGKLIQLARLKASTTIRELCIRKLLFADDAAIVAHTLDDTREICQEFEQAKQQPCFDLQSIQRKPPSGQTSIDQHVEIYGKPQNQLRTSHTWAALEPLEDCGSMYGHNMVFQSPQSAKCTRQLCFQHYCTQQRHTFSTIAILENFPKSISDIYGKSCGSHRKITFQMLKS